MLCRKVRVEERKRLEEAEKLPRDAPSKKEHFREPTPFSVTENEGLLLCYAVGVYHRFYPM